MEQNRSPFTDTIWVLAGLLAYFLLASYALYSAYTAWVTSRVGQALLAGWLALAAGLGIVAALWLYRRAAFEEAMRRAAGWLHNWPAWAGWGVYFALLLLPLPFLFTGLARGLLNDTAMRLAVYIPLVLLAALVCPAGFSRGYGWSVLYSALWASFLLQAGAQLTQLTAYPFSLTWSEGNRFYDYSLVFGQALYDHPGPIEVNYFSPGRYGLWGVWFLFPGLPIWFHRLWNAVLWILPPLLIGLAASSSLKDRAMRNAVALWLALFLMQGPIYAPLLLAALVVMLARRTRFQVNAGLLVLAGWYAGISRWTWSFAAGAWGGLIDLFQQYPQRQGPWLRRIAPTLVLGLAGILPGLIALWERIFQPMVNRLIAPAAETADKQIVFSQPLLWYRLLPNPTYPPGILLGTALATGPVLLLLGWLAFTRRWKLDRLQWVSASGLLLATLFAGLVASTKIGGGSNLHNLDMYLITLAMLVMLFLDSGEFRPQEWPRRARSLAALAALLPALLLVSSGQPLALPSMQTVSEALEKIRNRVEQAQARGEVLFLDQRQLLTFGQVRGVPLVHDYEKKFMMDQAMAGNSDYFEEFYSDLAARRFALIISEPLFTRQQDRSKGFSEENNAWVQWVSEPLLCYYEPVLNLKEIKVQLLTPRQGELDCP